MFANCFFPFAFENKEQMSIHYCYIKFCSLSKESKRHCVDGNILLSRTGQQTCLILSTFAHLFG